MMTFAYTVCLWLSFKWWLSVNNHGFTVYRTEMNIKVGLQCSVDDVLNLVHDVVLGEEMALVSEAVDKH